MRLFFRFLFKTFYRILRFTEQWRLIRVTELRHFQDFLSTMQYYSKRKETNLLKAQKRKKNHKTKKVSLNEARLFVIIERNPLKKSNSHDLAHLTMKGQKHGF